MAPLVSTLRKLVEEPAPLCRTAPNNIEAERALLGATLINNEAFGRIPELLAAAHFFEPIHREIFEICSKLIPAGKIATPVTLKPFLDANSDIGGMTVSQYLARLAAEATTAINAKDFGHAIYDLSVRRSLIRVGQEIIDVAYDAPVDFAPRKQIEDTERKLYKLAEPGDQHSGFQSFGRTLTAAVDMAASAFQMAKVDGLR